MTTAKPSTPPQDQHVKSQAPLSGSIPPRTERHEETQAALASKDKAMAMATAASQGKLPTTEQTTAAIDRLTQSGAFDQAAEGLSPAGKQLVQDAQRLTETARENITSKNESDHLQEAIYQSKQAVGEAKDQGHLKGITTTPDLPTDAGAQAARKLTQVARLTASSPEFRQLVREAFAITRDVLVNSLPTDDTRKPVPTPPGDIPQYQQLQGQHQGQQLGQQQLGQRQQPHQQHISQYGDAPDYTPAPSNPTSNAAIFQSAPQHPIGQRPDLPPRTGVAATGPNPFENSSVDASQRGSLGGAAHDYSQRAPIEGSASGLSQSDPLAPPTLPSRHDPIPGTDHSYQQAFNAPGSVRGNDPHATHQDTEARMKESILPAVGSAISSAAPHIAEVRRGEASVGDKTNQAGTYIKDTVSHIARETRLSQDQKDRLYDRLRAFLRSLQSHPEYQSSIGDLTHLLTSLASAAQEKVQDLSTGIKDVRGLDYTDSAEYHSRLLLENFAGGRSMAPLLSAITSLRAAMANDDIAKEYIRDSKRLLESTLRDPAALDAPQNRTDFERLMDRGRDLYNGTYRPLLSALFDEATAFLEGFSEDRLNRAFFADAQTLVKNAFLGPDGQATLRPELIQDIATLLVRLSAKLKYLPLPRIDISDKDMDLTLDDVVIYAADILPSQIQLRTATAMEIHPEAATPAVASSPHAKAEDLTKVRTAVRLILQEIRVEAKDVAFLLDRKSTPKVRNAGLLDFSMQDGKGMLLDMVLTTGTRPGTSSTESPARYIKLERINVDISGLNLHFHDTGHDILYKIFGPILNSRATREIESALQAFIQDQLTPSELKRGQEPHPTKVSFSTPTPLAQPGVEDRARGAGWKSDAYNV